MPIPTVIPTTDTATTAPTLLDVSSLPTDTIAPDLERGSSRGLALQPGGQATQRPDGGVVYGSRDSSITDLVTQKIHLYGQAYVRYEDVEVTSDYIILDLNTNEVEARSAPIQEQRPLFKSGEQNVEADLIRFNLETQQGLVHGARIRQDDYYIHGATTCLLYTSPSPRDRTRSRMPSSA